MYSSLTTAAPNITAAQIGKFFKDATFGVKSGDVAGSESPEPGVTIVRDKQFGVPHIYGDTRAELMFGIGYATAEDRLFFIDALRHAGQGDARAVRRRRQTSAMDESVWASEPYTQQDLVNQVNYGLTHSPLRPADLQRRDQLRRRNQRVYRRGQEEPAVHRDSSRASTSRCRTGRSRSRSRTSSRSRRSSAASSATAAATS